MKIDIWSDIACPFCYIGKRHLEQALATFAQSNSVEVEWHSFQLAPDLASGGGKSIHQYLADAKGMSLDQAKAAGAQVTAMAAAAGLTFDMDRIVVTNTWNAHRLIQLAKSAGKDDAVEEALFQAYFVEGRNVGDTAVLNELAQSAGLDAAALLGDSQAFAAEVSEDIAAAQQIGVRGVPFFVFDGKYALSGAQPVEVFGQVLDKVWQEAQPQQGVGDGAACGPEGTCS